MTTFLNVNDSYVRHTLEIQNNQTELKGETIT